MPANIVNLKKERANEHCSYSNPNFIRKGNISAYVCNTPKC